MKDKTARDDIKELREIVIGKRVGDKFYPGLMGRLRDLEFKVDNNRILATEDAKFLQEHMGIDAKRLGDIEDRLGDAMEFVERDCPTCGRLTLMKAMVPKITEPIMDRDDFRASFSGEKTHLYCFSCGFAYRETSKTVLEVVE